MSKKILKNILTLLAGAVLLLALVYCAIYFAKLRFAILSLDTNNAVSISATPLKGAESKVEGFTATIQARLLPNTVLDPYIIEQYINNERTAKKLQPLRDSTILNKSAADKLTDMIENDYWAHTSPTGKNPWNFIADQGYDFVAAGENLAKGYYTNEQAVIDDWMNSPTHRDVILNPKFCDIGISVQKVRTFMHDTNIFLIVMHTGVRSTTSVDSCTATK